MSAIERVEVFRGGHKDPQEGLFGPLPAVRLGNAIAYEFELPARFVPWPDRTRLERVYVLLHLGISMSNPCWHQCRTAAGDFVQIPDSDESSWYVELISVQRSGDQYVFRDLFIDVWVPTDHRHYRILDLDEFADAFDDGRISFDDAVSGLRRWQAFLDAHLHSAGFPVEAWTDFPPAVLKPLIDLPPPLAEPVRWEG